MSRSVSYQIRLSDDEKTAAFSVFRELGITPAQAVRLFLRQVVETRSIPFPIKTANGCPVHDAHVPNEQLSQDLKALIEESAKANNRTLNAEITARRERESN